MSSAGWAQWKLFESDYSVSLVTSLPSSVRTVGVQARGRRLVWRRVPDWGLFDGRRVVPCAAGADITASVGLHAFSDGLLAQILNNALILLKRS